MKSSFLRHGRRGMVDRHSSAAAGVGDLSGRETVNVLPAFTWLSTVSVPPWISAIHFAMERPKPVPPNSRERALSTR